MTFDAAWQGWRKVYAQTPARRANNNPLKHAYRCCWICKALCFTACLPHLVACRFHDFCLFFVVFYKDRDQGTRDQGTRDQGTSDQWTNGLQTKGPQTNEPSDQQTATRQSLFSGPKSVFSGEHLYFGVEHLYSEVGNPILRSNILHFRSKICNLDRKSLI